MTTASTFETMFQKSRAEIPVPKTLPRGHYVLALRATFKRPPREEGKSGQLSFSFEALEPMEDVDPGELEALGENYSIKDNKISADFWLGENNPQDWHRVWEHLAYYGVKSEDFADLDTALKAAVNKRIVAYVSPDTYVHPVKGPQTKDVASGFKLHQ